MGMFDSPFGFTDPNSMALLGMLGGLGQASSASRLPVTFGSMMGSLAGGAMQGAAQGQQAQLGQQMTAGKALENATALDNLAYLAKSLGVPPPSMQDILSGNFKGTLSAVPQSKWDELFGGGGAAVPGQTPITTPSVPYTPPAPGVGGAMSRAAVADASALSAKLQQMGYTPVQAAAVLGNGQHESSLNPANTSGDGGTSQGMFQWHAPERKAGLMAYAQQSGRPWTDPNVQIEYMDRELRQMAPEFFQSRDLASATKIFQDKFEIPKNDTSQARTQLAKNFLSPGAPASGAAPPVPSEPYQRGEPTGVTAARLQRGENPPLSPADRTEAELARKRLYGNQAATAASAPQEPATPRVQVAQNTASGAVLTDAGNAMAQGQSSQDVLAAPGMQRMILGAKVKQLMKLPITPVEQYLIGASTAPAGPMRDLLMQGAFHAAGIEPFKGGERPGNPIFRYNPNTGSYDLSGLNPATAPGSAYIPGAGGGVGSIVQIPGAASAERSFAVAKKLPEAPPGAEIRQGLQGLSMSMVPGAQQAIGSETQTRTGAAEQAKNVAKFGDLMPGGAINPAPSGATAAPAVKPGEPVPFAAAAQNPNVAISNPVATDRGTVLPPLSQQGPLGSPAELESSIPVWAKTTAEWTASLGPAQQAEQRLQTMANAYKIIQSGAFETRKAELASMLKGIGIDATKVLTDPGAAELALHENYLQTLNRLKATTSRFTQQEFRVISSQSEHPNLQPEANLQMLSEDLAILRQAQQLPRDWVQAHQLGWRNPSAFESAWTEANPLHRTVDAVKAEIGPLRGMPGFVDQNAPTNKAPIPPFQSKTIGGTTYHLIDGQWRPVLK